MGTMVGVIPQINYLEQSPPEAIRFLGDLTDPAQVKLDEADELPWVIGDGENTIIEFTRVQADVVLASGYSHTELTVIHAWLDSLPWRDSTIMLHVSS